MPKINMYREPLERYFRNKLLAQAHNGIALNNLAIDVVAAEHPEYNWTITIPPGLPGKIQDAALALASILQEQITMIDDETAGGIADPLDLILKCKAP